MKIASFESFFHAIPRLAYDVVDENFHAIA